MRKILYLLLLMVGLAGCRSSKQAAGIAVPETAHYLSSRLQLTIPSGANGSITTGGTMKMKGGERVQLSILMPILRTEIARLEITPDEILLVDRMNKRYVRASRSELNDILPKEARFSKLEKLLLDASLPEGKSESTVVRFFIQRVCNDSYGDFRQIYSSAAYGIVKYAD